MSARWIDALADYEYTRNEHVSAMYELTRQLGKLAPTQAEMEQFNPSLAVDPRRAQHARRDARPSFL